MTMRPLLSRVLFELSDAALLIEVGKSVGNALPAGRGKRGCGAGLCDKVPTAMPLAASGGPGQTLSDGMASPKAAARGALPPHEILPSFAGYAVFLIVPATLVFLAFCTGLASQH